MSAPIFDAELLLECQNVLGEGIAWDDKTNLLHWVDLDEARLHTYDPETKGHSVDSYADESKYLTAFAPRVSEPGFVATFTHSVVLLPAATAPTSTDARPTPVPRRSVQQLSAPLGADAAALEQVRFNDGAADGRGRWFGGSMTRPEAKDGARRGQLWRLDADGKETMVLDAVGTSNGLGWSPDDKLMYYIDSLEDRISVFDYDVETGTPANRRTFAQPPPGIDGRETAGVFDGLTVDGAGNVWAARWKDGRLVGFRPDGSLMAHIRVKGCKSPTIPCFGGKDLSTMYIATAHAKLANEGDIQAEFPHSGDLFKIECGPGSALGEVLGAGWKGRARYRFGA